MNIFVVSSGFPSEKYPLLGIFEFDQVQALARKGCQVVFLAVDLRSIFRWRKWGIVKGSKNGVDYYIYNLPLGRLPIKFLCKIGEFCLFRLYKIAIKKHGKPDVLHAHFTEMGCITSRLSAKVGIPYVVTEHSSKINQYVIDNALRDCASEAYRNAHIVIAVGKSLSNNIFRHTGIKSIVIPNIINTDLFFQCKRIKHSGFRLVTTSNLIILKRTWQILQALAMISPKDIDYYLTVIGDGPERDTIEYWIKALDLEDRVSIAGYKSREAIATIYENSDAFIMVSSSETFGVAYVEAMAAGLPVIATRCGGPEDFVNNNNGYLIDVDSISQLCFAITQLYNNREHFKTDDLRQYVRNNYSPEVVAARLLNVYKSIE